MTKSELRQKYKALRQELSPNDIESWSLAITNNLLKLPIWEHEFYHIFLPIEEQNEVNTEFILNILAGKDKNIVVAKSDFKTLKLTHYLLTDTTAFRKNSYGIPEPVGGIEIPTQQIDVVFVPLLAYDQLGNRVGYGKGFYDRFLSECKKDVITIGLSFYDAEEIINDISTMDFKIDHCVTPKRTYSF